MARREALSVTVVARGRGSPPRTGRTGRRRLASSAAGRPRRSRGGRRWGRLFAALLVLGVCAWGGLFAWGFLPASSTSLPPRTLAIVNAERSAAVDALTAAGLIEAPFLMTAYMATVAPLAPVVAREHWL